MQCRKKYTNIQKRERERERTTTRFAGRSLLGNVKLNYLTQKILRE